MCVHTELYVPPSTYGPTNVVRVMTNVRMIYMCYDVHYFSPISSIKDGHTSTI